MESLKINSRALIRVLGFLNVLIVLAGAVVVNFKAHYDTQYLDKTLDIFDLNKENNIPTWFSSVGLLICGVCAWLSSQLPSQRKSRIQWSVLSFIFIAMSLDETASIHEWSGSIMKGQHSFTGIWHFAWVIPGLILITAGVIYFFRFWWNLPFAIKTGLAIAAIVYFSGAVGMELVGGELIEVTSKKSPLYLLSTLAEETMEFTGTWLFIRSLLGFLAAERMKSVVEINDLKIPVKERKWSLVKGLSYFWNL